MLSKYLTMEVMELFSCVRRGIFLGVDVDGTRRLQDCSLLLGSCVLALVTSVDGSACLGETAFVCSWSSERVCRDGIREKEVLVEE